MSFLHEIHDCAPIKPTPKTAPMNRSQKTPAQKAITPEKIADAAIFSLRVNGSCRSALSSIQQGQISRPSASRSKTSLNSRHQSQRPGEVTYFIDKPSYKPEAFQKAPRAWGQYPERGHRRSQERDSARRTLHPVASILPACQLDHILSLAKLGIHVQDFSLCNA